MTDSKARAARARTTAIAAAVLGLAAGTAVIGYFNFGAVLAAIQPVGLSGFALVIASQLALFAPLGLAWWLVSSSPAGLAPVFAWARLMREAASDVLPFSQLGGIVISTRAAVLGGVGAPTSLGACMVDISFEIVGQLIYTLFGLALLAHQLGFAAHNSRLLAVLLGGVTVAAIMVGGFIISHQRSLDLVERLVGRLAPGNAHHATAVRRVVETAYGQPLRLWGGLGLHMVGWFGAAGGTWLTLRLIGHPLPYLSVVAIESLLFAIRNAAFIVPGGLGVQEGAYALLGPLFGLPAEAALALSLIKRARDIAIGVPMLLTWQMAESRVGLKRGAPDPVHD